QVMYGGMLFETADTDTVYHASRNPYTRGLMSSIPTAASRTSHRLLPIQGSPPSAINPPPGCVFRPRCVHATDRCREEEPDLRPLDPDRLHWSRCHYAEELPPLGAADAAGSRT
ncbi:MAG: oligopeptide/dipeptide ABC transporter ATP-binding protein, partial [Nitriliruptor sp.]|uniref:oligopeptide/dipeptide ABC transporter ATP-binding protein n=1 Tax=Nitriliruptor sp. TaxID=2448056 RepID=UPI0034A039EA